MFGSNLIAVKIRKIEVYQSRIKLRDPFVISLGLLVYAENIIVKIQTDNGLTGFGECSPFMTINGESMETCFVVAQYLGKALIEKDPLTIEANSLLMDTIIYGNSSIKSAFDIALHDIAAQDANVPLYKFLGGSDNKTIITDYTVSFGEPHKMAADAKQIKENGFQIIKVKLGESKEKDVERIRMIREEINYDIPVRIDANQGWDTETAIVTLNALAPFNIQHCEEPIPRWNFIELSKVRKQSPIPLMADESCFDHHDAKRLIDLEACDYLNIKLGKSSGIFKVVKIIQLAEQADFKMQVGGFLESRLGFTASAHLALTSDHIIYYDFDTPLMQTVDPVVGGITYHKNGIIKVPDSPGLGATVDAQFLKNLPKVVIQ